MFLLINYHTLQFIVYFFLLQLLCYCTLLVYCTQFNLNYSISAFAAFYLNFAVLLFFLLYSVLICDTVFLCNNFICTLQFINADFNYFCIHRFFCCLTILYFVIFLQLLNSVITLFTPYMYRTDTVTVIYTRLMRIEYLLFCYLGAVTELLHQYTLSFIASFLK